MGDRAVVTFKDGSESSGWNYSPAVYLHWGGGSVAGLLQDALPRMRTGDNLYSAARFCGVCHEHMDGNTSLGLLPGPADNAEAISDDYSHGDAGVFIVDVNTWRVEAVNGYGFNIDDDAGPCYSLQLDASLVP